MKTKKTILQLNKLKISNLSIIQGGGGDNDDPRRSEKIGDCPPATVSQNQL